MRFADLKVTVLSFLTLVFEKQRILNKQFIEIIRTVLRHNPQT